jgi:ArsR family transcriptional regulator
VAETETETDIDAECSGQTHPDRTSFVAHPRSVLSRAAAMLNAAGDPARLRLLLHLAEGERCVTELAETEQEKMATISARLKILHTARLITRRREAKHVHYSLADHHVLRLVHDIIEHAAEEYPNS